MTRSSDIAQEPLVGHYSPRRIRFWLAHWDSLLAWAESPGSSHGERELLEREWLLLVSDHHASEVCACAKTNNGIATAEVYRSAGAFGPADHTAAEIMAELELAADRLPIHWQATASVYVSQRRNDDYYERYRSWRDHGEAVRQSEPRGSEHIVIEQMAQSLGWRS